MKNYVVLQKDGQIRSGVCQDCDFELQVRVGEQLIEGIIDQVCQKVVDGVIVNKTQAEIDAQKPKPVPEEDLSAHITNKEWSSVLSRLEHLETVIGI